MNEWAIWSKRFLWTSTIAQIQTLWRFKKRGGGEEWWHWTSQAMLQINTEMDKMKSMYSKLNYLCQWRQTFKNLFYWGVECRNSRHFETDEQTQRLTLLCTWQSFIVTWSPLGSNGKDLKEMTLQPTFNALLWKETPKRWLTEIHR